MPAAQHPALVPKAISNRPAGRLDWGRAHHAPFILLGRLSQVSAFLAVQMADTALRMSQSRWSAPALDLAPCAVPLSCLCLRIFQLPARAPCFPHRRPWTLGQRLLALEYSDPGLPGSGPSGTGLTAGAGGVQAMMAERLMFLAELQATVLEVKVVEGLGTTVDIVLVNGVLREGETIVLCGLQGPIVTTIRSLLTPHPLKACPLGRAWRRGIPAYVCGGLAHGRVLCPSMHDGVLAEDGGCRRRMCDLRHTMLQLCFDRGCL